MRAGHKHADNDQESVSVNRNIFADYSSIGYEKNNVTISDFKYGLPSIFLFFFYLTTI